MPFVIEHLTFVHCAILENYDAVASAFALLHFAYVNFMLADTWDFYAVQVLFQLVYEFLVERFVELGEELLHFELW